MKTKTETGLTIGMDLGDRRHTVCVLNAAGDIVAEEVLTNTREVLAAFSLRFPMATIVMETGTHSPWVSRLFEARPSCAGGERAEGARDLPEYDQERWGGRAHVGSAGSCGPRAT